MIDGGLFNKFRLLVLKYAFKMMCGGTTEAKAADEEIQAVIDEVKAAVESKVGRQFEVYRAVQYKTQVVAGTNYFVKVDVGGGTHVHLRIFKPLPHTNQPKELAGVQDSKSVEDSLEYF